jgi:ParB-like chromosome segregation protein Spo0J
MAPMTKRKKLVARLMQDWGWTGLAVDEIVVGPRPRRQLDEKTVADLMQSISAVGLLNPITIYSERMVDGEGHAIINDAKGRSTFRNILSAGLHRLEAVKRLGWSHVPCRILDGIDGIEAQLAEVAENLHRSELTVQERSEHIERWLELLEEKRKRDAEETAKLDEEHEGQKPGQVARVSGGRGKEGGVSAAARELGLERTEVRRALKIASITPEAKEAAKAAGIDDNQAKLLQVASAPAAEQVQAVAMARKKSTNVDDQSKKPSSTNGNGDASSTNVEALDHESRIDADLHRLQAAWEAACIEARAFFLASDSVCDVLAELGCDPRTKNHLIGARVRAMIAAGCEDVVNLPPILSILVKDIDCSDAQPMPTAEPPITTGQSAWDDLDIPENLRRTPRAAT